MKNCVSLDLSTSLNSEVLGFQLVKSEFKVKCWKVTKKCFEHSSTVELDEAVTGCRIRTHNHQLSVELRQLILSSESLLMRVDPDTLLESWKLYKSRKEIPLSLTDCTSAILAKKRGDNRRLYLRQRHWNTRIPYHSIIVDPQGGSDTLSRRHALE